MKNSMGCRRSAGFAALVMAVIGAGCTRQPDTPPAVPGLVNLPVLQNTAPQGESEDVIANGVASCPTTGHGDELPGRWPPCPTGVTRIAEPPTRTADSGSTASLAAKR